MGPPRLHSLPLRSASSPDQPVPLSGEPDPSWREKRSRRVLPSMRQVARKRAQQRWSALLTAKKSRLAREMKAALGERCWAEFLVYAARYKRSRALRCGPRVLLGARGVVQVGI